MKVICLLLLVMLYIDLIELCCYKVVTNNHPLVKSKAKQNSTSKVNIDRNAGKLYTRIDLELINA